MTIREVAEIAGVSPATVSLVLNNKKGVSKETREQVQKIIRENNYNPNKSLERSPRIRIIFIKYFAHGMAVEENGGFISAIIDQIEQECRQYSYDLVIKNCNRENIGSIFEEIKQSAPDGIIFLGTEFYREDYKQLNRLNIPLVVLDNLMGSKAVDSVVMDNEELAKQATNYLYDLGHRQIGYFKCNIFIPNLDARHNGYRARLDKLGIEQTEPILLTPTLNGAYNDMKKLLAENKYKPKGAVVADNDSIAIGAMRALREAGYKLPKELSVIGVDDIPYSAINMPALTTMRISRTALGVLAIDTLRKRMEHKDWPAMKVEILATLIKRDSTTVVE